MDLLRQEITKELLVLNKTNFKCYMRIVVSIGK